MWGEYRAGVPLAGVLDAARVDESVRVMLTGERPARAWFLDAAPGWRNVRVFLDADTPAARYEHATGHTVEIRRAAEWFGEGIADRTLARNAWDATRRVLVGSGQTGAAMFRSPGATGLDLWIRSAHGELPDALPDDVQSLIRSTTPQHRIETFPNLLGRDAPAIWVLDGRWMYAALVRELGTGPATMLTQEQARDHSVDAYARARYRVRFSAPEYWRDLSMPGVFMAPAGEYAADGWHAPYDGEAWVDAAELHLARRFEWSVDVLGGIAYRKGRPLDTWGDRLIRARERATDDALGEVAPYVRNALRSVMLHGIGSWHATGRVETAVTDSPMTAPDGDGWGKPDKLENGRMMWRRPSPASTERAAAMRHPEWSAGIWGRAHARILESPTSTNRKAGALYVKSGELVSIYGDAIVTTTRPHWADLDDGRPGRLRVKGHLCGPVQWPQTARERDEIVAAASAAGIQCERGCV